MSLGPFFFFSFPVRTISGSHYYFLPELPESPHPPAAAAAAAAATAAAAAAATGRQGRTEAAEAARIHPEVALLPEVRALVPQ